MIDQSICDSPPKKRACVGHVRWKHFFGLTFFGYFLVSRQESNNRRNHLSINREWKLQVGFSFHYLQLFKKIPPEWREIKIGNNIHRTGAFCAGPPKKRACVSLARWQLFFGLNFFGYFLVSRQESNNQGSNLSISLQDLFWILKLIPATLQKDSSWMTRT